MTAPPRSTPTGTRSPQLGSVALQAGGAVAASVLAAIDGQPAPAFRYHDKGVMAMIGHGAAVAEMDKRHHELHGSIAFAAWLGVHAWLLSTTRARIDAFVNWAWDSFSNSRGPAIVDDIDTERIDWGDRDTEPEGGDMIENARAKVFWAVVVLTIACAVLTFVHSIWWLIGVGTGAALTAIGVWDLLQQRHSILRNYPIVGHLRFLLEDTGPELHQYLVENDIEGRPFDRDTRSLIYGQGFALTAGKLVFGGDVAEMWPQARSNVREVL